MAKHPHRLILQNKKTWKCTLDGCSFFVHLGLAHILIGKTGICWDCNEQFTIDEYALREEMPRCMDCRSNRTIAPIIESVKEIEPAKPIEEEKMSPERRKIYKELGLIK